MRKLLKFFGFYKCEWFQESPDVYILKIDGSEVLRGGAPVKDFILGAFGIKL